MNNQSRYIRVIIRLKQLLTVIRVLIHQILGQVKEEIFAVQVEEVLEGFWGEQAF